MVSLSTVHCSVYQSQSRITHQVGSRPMAMSTCRIAVVTELLLLVFTATSGSYMQQELLLVDGPPDTVHFRFVLVWTDQGGL